MNLFNIAAALTLNSTAYEKGLTDAEDKANGFGSRLKSGLGKAAKLSGVALTAASTAVVAFGKDSVQAGIDFDKSMAQVAATMGVTVDEITDLRNFAQQMGASTAFSATEAADALNYMALAGYDADTAMKMLPNVLNLAAAGGIDLASASDMVTDAQSALGLTLDQTTEMVDKMAKASSKSNTSVAQLGEAFLTIGGTAKNLTGGTTELATALGILADNGIKGSEGGTALRNILLSLTPKSEDAAKAMKAIGLNAYDANGEMRPLADIFGDMNKAMSKMTTKERQNILANIFNKVDLKSVNALMATSADRWGELTDAIDDAQGASQKMAETQLDNLAGDITLFKSALEGAKIAVSDKLTPTLRGFVQFGGDALQKLTEAFKEGGLTGAMDALGTILSDGLAMVIQTLPEVVGAGTQLLLSLLQGVIDNLPLIVDAVSQILLQMGTSIGELMPELIPSIVEACVTAASSLVEQLPQFLDALTSIITGIADGISTAVPIIVEALPQIIDSIVGFITDPETLNLLIESGITLLTAMVGGLTDIITAIVEALPDIIDALVDYFLDPKTIKMIVEAGVDLITSLVDSLDEIIDAILEVLPTIITSLTDAIVGAIPQLAQAGLQLFVALVQKLPEIITEIVKAAPQIISRLISGFAQGIGQMANVGLNLVKGLWNGISDAASWVLDKIKDFGNKILGGIKKFFGIHSPSTVFRDQIGKNIALGLGDGIDDYAYYAVNAMDALAEDVMGAADLDPTLAIGTANNGGFGFGGARGVQVTQNIYAQKMTPSEIFEEAREQQERLVLLGV